MQRHAREPRPRDEPAGTVLLLGIWPLLRDLLVYRVLGPGAVGQCGSHAVDELLLFEELGIA